MSRMIWHRSPAAIDGVAHYLIKCNKFIQSIRSIRLLDFNDSSIINSLNIYAKALTKYKRVKIRTTVNSEVSAFSRFRSIMTLLLIQCITQLTKISFIYFGQQLINILEQIISLLSPHKSHFVWTFTVLNFFSYANNMLKSMRTMRILPVIYS